jgi:hypothetical protein
MSEEAQCEQWPTPTGSRPSKGRDFITIIRLYGAGVEFFDQTWKPDDVVKVN